MTDPTSTPDFPPPSNVHPLRGRVLDVLFDEGYRPDLDADGDIAVKVAGQQLYLRCAEGEITLLRMFGQWRLDDTATAGELNLLRACNAVSSRLSVAKTTLGDGILVVSADHVVTPGTPLQMIVTSSIELVLNAVNLWHESLAEITGTGPNEQPPGIDGPGSTNGSGTEH